MFITLEDHTGVANIVVSPKTFEKHRRPVMVGRPLRIRGRLQREGIVIHVIPSRIENLSVLLDTLGDSSSDGAGIDPLLPSADDIERPVSGGVENLRPLPEAVTLALQRARRAAGAGIRANKLFSRRDFH